MLLRSIIFNVVFYVNTLVYLTIALPTFLLPYRWVLAVAQAWGRANLVLLRLLVGINVEFRGLEKIPQGPLIVAAKHQSAWETFALITLFENPLFILKRELLWIPIFGWLLSKARMVPIDRRAAPKAVMAMTSRAIAELRRGRQLIIFPEGTRRPAGAEPKYKSGVAHLYQAADVPCLPVALNSGLFWPRRSIRRVPGTIIVEILDPIPPGMDKGAFGDKLQHDIEVATARLVEEGKREIAGRSG
ncbi:MAG TPA: lysophospholipid acyltransferase family protein [Pseudolabrys sp.]|nr:lysophospholipid acyltransferase family protein [Pseudolabrys sp.]